jgi:hypothetical protein
MEMLMSDRDSALQRLVDQSAIRDVLARYARGVDRCDWDLIRAAFHTEATDDHGPNRGGVESLIDWVSRRHVLIGQSMHFLGNILIEFADNDRALVETYYAAYQRLGPEATESRTMLLGESAGDETMDVTVLGRYIDRFERRNGEWRIARRTNVFEAIRSNIVADPSQNPDYNWAQRDRTDKLYSMHQDVFGGN